MILQPANVELTKVHYYDKCRNVGISTISREVFQNEFNRNVIIKKNIFGHRWVLKVNENDRNVRQKSNRILVVYVLVFCSIVIAISFGVFFTLERKYFSKLERSHDGNNTIKMPIPNFTTNWLGKVTDKSIYTTLSTSLPNLGTNKIFCQDCNETIEVCLKRQEMEKPKCHQIINKKDPTGCGGLCKINTQYCQLLDSKNKVYQCSHIKNILKCPLDSFNCGNRCIALDKKCDGLLHCSNKSDEENCDCNLETHFRCGNSTSCIANSARCDGVIDCWDKTDEKGCKERCFKDEFPCLNGQCIDRDHFCDGIRHCNDGSDEPQGCI